MAKDITTKELIINSINDGEARVCFLNESIMEISKSRGKKSGFIKFAVTDETAGKFMLGSKSLVGIILMVDRDYVNTLINGPEATVPTESA